MKLQAGKSRVEVENPDAPLRQEIVDRLGREIAQQIQDFVLSKGTWAFEESKRTGEPVPITMDPRTITVTPPSSSGTADVKLLIGSSS